MYFYVANIIRNAKVEGSIPFTGTTLALHAPRYYYQ